jgi:hypothetical protein
VQPTPPHALHYVGTLAPGVYYTQSDMSNASDSESGLTARLYEQRYGGGVSAAAPDRSALRKASTPQGLLESDNAKSMDDLDVLNAVATETRSGGGEPSARASPELRPGEQRRPTHPDDNMYSAIGPSTGPYAARLLMTAAALPPPDSRAPLNSDSGTWTVATEPYSSLTLTKGQNAPQPDGPEPYASLALTTGPCTPPPDETQIAPPGPYSSLSLTKGQSAAAAVAEPYTSLAVANGQSAPPDGSRSTRTSIV